MTDYKQALQQHMQIQSSLAVTTAGAALLQQWLQTRLVQPDSAVTAELLCLPRSFV
jgi:hypothetical protein